MNKTTISAIYEAKRLSFLMGFIAHPDRVDPALAFAHYYRVAPVFHEDDLREVHGEDPFEDAYAVKADFARRVLAHIDQHWQAGQSFPLGFYDLEQFVGGHHDHRGELIRLLEYARISGRFDQAVYEAIEKNAPMEAQRLDASFGPEDVFFN